MNLQDTDLIKLREQVFDNYRNAIIDAKKVDQEIKILKQDLETKHGLYMKKIDEINSLKALIDIMIVENCDPVTAKLKHDDLIEQQKKEAQEFSIIDNNKYGYGFASSKSHTVPYPTNPSTSLLDIYDH